jgi:uncharacterized protein
VTPHQPAHDLGRINGTDFAQILQNFQVALQTHESEINSLNVFPVPDSDTGTNSLLTVESGISGLVDSTQQQDSLKVVVEKFAKFASANARGNSGTILAEYFRGLALGLEGESDVANWHSALQIAASCAVDAVLTPYEGTILTVAQAIAQVRPPIEMFAYLGDVTHVAKLALLQTTNQLESLRQAQVVDAGACVLVLFHECVSSFYNGHQINISFVATSPNFATHQKYIGPEFELTLSLKTQHNAREALKASLCDLGESLTIAGAPPEFKIHIHTDSVDEVLNAVAALGEVSMVGTTSLTENMPKS